MENAYRLRQLSSQDVDEHAHNLSMWEQRYDQVAPGRFAGALTEFWTPDAQIFLERTGRAVRQRCCVWDDALWFGVPVRHDGTRIDGRVAPEGAVLVHPGGDAFELHTPSDHEIFGIVVRRAAIEHFCDILGVKATWPRLEHAAWVETEAAERAQCVAALRTLFGMLADNDAIATQEASRRSLGDAVLSLLLPFVAATPQAAEARGAFGRRRTVVASILAQIEAHPDWVPTVPELCARFHVSRRSLQYAFEDVLGVSPLTYLRTLRLNGVRRTLRDAGSDIDSVQHAAAAWGFCNLSQFSQDYRRLFGERPSETLARFPRKGRDFSRVLSTPAGIACVVGAHVRSLDR